MESLGHLAKYETEAKTPQGISPLDKLPDLSFCFDAHGCSLPKLKRSGRTGP